MTDYTKEVIAFHKKQRNIENNDSILCFEMKDWIKRQICEYRIDELIVDYVDFHQMILDEDGLTIYVIYRDGRISSLANWDNESKEYLASARPNSVFLVFD